MALYLKDFVVIRTFETVSGLSDHFDLSAWANDQSEVLIPGASGDEVWVVVEYLAEYGFGITASSPEITFIGTADAIHVYIQNRLHDFRSGDIRHSDSITESEFNQYIQRKCNNPISFLAAINGLKLQGALLDAPVSMDIDHAESSSFTQIMKKLPLTGIMSVSVDGNQSLLFDITTDSLPWLLGLSMALTGSREIEQGCVVTPTWCSQDIVENHRSMFANGLRAGYQTPQMQSDDTGMLF